MLDISQLVVLYEDNHLIAVNKPGGWLVQGDRTGDVPLSEFVKTYIKLRYKKPGDVFLGTIHRLDRPVSGTVIFARTSKGLERMNRLFQERKVQKVYWALTAQRPYPLQGHLEHYILKDPAKNKSKALDQIGRRTKDAKLGSLDYKMIGEIDGKHLIEVKPITGRPHQIRVQLSTMGYPIIGDLKYGYKNANPDGCIHLHCRSLSFEHPVKKVPVTIEADPPDVIDWRAFETFM
ncbi:MAG: RluA family pseudouridine synthase [Bacteroidota bacterium]